MTSFTTNNFQETQNIAADFAKGLKTGCVICLYGDLGYGKTTFVQGFARGLGIKKKILSPTFIIVRTYEIKNKKENRKMINNIKNFYHVDLYRITDEREISDLGLVDMMDNPENIVLIEWPEKLGKFLPKRRIDVRFEYIDENKRKLEIIKEP